MEDLLQTTLRDLRAARAADNAHLILGDAVKILGQLPTGSVDLCFADPPYFLSNGGTTNHGGERVAVDKGGWDASAGVRADHEYHRRWLRAVQRVLRPDGSLWVSGTQHCIYSIGWALQLGGWRIINHVTWRKPNPPPNLGARCLTHSTEAVIWASPNHDEPQRHLFNYDDAKAANEGKQLKDVWDFTAPGADEKTHGKHPAQKPVALLRRILELASAPGGVVLDPFAGSCTTGVAALELGRQFVGVEKEPAYFELGLRRLGAALPAAA